MVGVGVSVSHADAASYRPLSLSLLPPHVPGLHAVPKPIYPEVTRGRPSILALQHARVVIILLRRCFPHSFAAKHHQAYTASCCPPTTLLSSCCPYSLFPRSSAPPSQLVRLALQRWAGTMLALTSAPSL